MREIRKIEHILPPLEDLSQGTNEVRGGVPHSHAGWMHVNAHRKKPRVWSSFSSIIRASWAHPPSLRQLVEAAVAGQGRRPEWAEAVLESGGLQRMVSGQTEKETQGQIQKNCFGLSCQ
jgi:hypothetical protein